MSAPPDPSLPPANDRTPQIVYPPARDIMVSTDGLILAVIGLSTGLGVVSIYAVIQVFMDATNRWFWIALLSAGLVAGITKILQIYRRHLIRISISPSELTMIENEAVIERVPLNDIKGYFFPSAGNANRIELTLRDGRDVTIGWSDFQSRRADLRRQFVRQIGPLLPKDVIHSQMVAPSNPVAKRLFEHFNAPPSVPMRPGVLYRYSDPVELKKHIASNKFPLMQILLTVSLIAAVQTLTHWQIAIIAPFIFNASLIDQLFWFLPRSRFKASLHDRFELVPEGLKVYRGTRSWIVQNPRPANQAFGRVVVANAPIVRYGKGYNAYFFDPRFIEPVTNNLTYQKGPIPSWKRRKP